MKFNKLNIWTGWVVFAISSIVYLLTIEPTASFWDCGEFIATAKNMEIGHPPGAPLWMILGQVFSIFSFGDGTAVAKSVNVMSALASGFTILFLFWSITHLARKMFMKSGEEKPGELLAVLGAGLVGALAYTFTDSFWFSAVEAEVYAMSSLFTAAVFWAILKWESVADEPGANRWLIFIGFLMGLSIGVHILNLLAAPAIVLVYYYKKYKVTTRGILISLGLSVVLLALFLYVVIQGTLKVASAFELFFINAVGLPFNFGVIIFCLVLVGALAFGLFYTQKKGKVLWNTTLLVITFVMVGFSSVMLIPVRSQANPPLDENNPDNTLSLLSYVNREVYGQRPLLFGEYYNAPIDHSKDGKKIYYQKDGKYEISDTRTEYVYDKRFTTFFPRMYNNLEQRYIDAYKEWGKVKGKPERVQRGADQTETRYVPTFAENMRFFFRYQLGHMYFRYFMWNFSGRQSDEQGYGNITAGNWITGAKFIDGMRLGPQDQLPDAVTKNKGHNRYYALPLILGLIGAWFYYKRNRKDFWVITLLFAMTGIAIIVYLNEVPVTPRERDYVYVGSFYAFAMFIGMGVLYLFDILRKWLKGPVSAVVATLAALIVVPGLLATENWDDHDRSNRYVAHDFAYNYLIGLEPNALIFTNGDNDTFPLWYIQEVERVRTDVRVCCMPFLPQDWYIDQLKRKYYESDPLPISMENEQYRAGKRSYVPIIERVNRPYDLKEIINFVRDDDPRTMVGSSGGRQFHYIPAATFVLPIDSAAVVNSGLVPLEKAGLLEKQIQWSMVPQGEEQWQVYKDELIILDILAHNNWERPMYYTTPNQSGSVGLDNYLELEGLSYKLTPIRGERQGATRGKVNTAVLYDNLMNKFRYTNFNDPDVYLDETCRRMMQNLKNNFSRLAETLVAEGKLTQAQEVLTKLEEVMPVEVIGYTYIDLKIAEIWFSTGNAAKGRDMIAFCTKALYDTLDYYLSMPAKLIPAVSNDIQSALMYELRPLMSVAEENGETEIYTEIEKRYNDYYSRYGNKIGQ